MVLTLYILNNGQSNAARTTQSINANVTVRRPGVAPTTAGCPAIAWAYAVELYNLTSEPVQILSTAVGGQEIDRYLSTDLNPSQWNMLTTVYSEAGSPAIYAEIFIQGEADSAEFSSETYLLKRRQMQIQLDSLIGNDFDTLTSCPVRHDNSGPHTKRSDALSILREKLGKRYFVLDTQDLTSDDGTHWNEPSGIEIGQRLFKAKHEGDSRWLTQPFTVRTVTLQSLPVTLHCFRPEIITVECLKVGTRLIVPNVHVAFGTIITVFSMGGCVVSEFVDDEVNQLSFGFRLGTKVTKTLNLNKGVWELRALPSRRWYCRKLED